MMISRFKFSLKCHCNEKIVNPILIVKEQHLQMRLRLRAHGNVFAWLCIVPQSQGNSSLLPNNRKRCENVTVCT